MVKMVLHSAILEAASQALLAVAIHTPSAGRYRAAD